MNKKLSVLIVDDDISLGDSLADILEAKGYDARFVTSGKEAVSIIKEKKYDVVLLDIRMPEMNGVETFMHIKEQSPLTTVVMITAYAESELVKQAKEENVLQVLSKPVDIDKVLGFLKKHELLKTILMVDDDPAFCNSLKDALELHGYNVTIAHSAEEAIESFSNQEYGIILLDMKLNSKNGLDVANAIRDQGYKCAFILMSAYKKEFQSLIDKTMLTSVFIEKPFAIDDILKLLNEVARKRLVETLD